MTSIEKSMYLKQNKDQEIQPNLSQKVTVNIKVAERVRKAMMVTMMKMAEVAGLL